MNDAGSRSASPDQASGRFVAFTGSRGELARIVIVNTLLMTITLGIYRFWAKTRVRRFYWRAVEIAGDPLEYTGRGLELFLGFLIVVAVAVPLLVLFGVAQNFLALSDPGLFALLELAVLAAIWWLIGYAVYRARRYRLTRTLWRGIRCGQDGSPARYATIRFGMSLLVPLTLGIMLPWYHVALRRYEMAHTLFGFSRFAYRGRGGELFRHWWPVLLALIVPVAGVAMILAGFGLGIAGGQLQPGSQGAAGPAGVMMASNLGRGGMVLLLAGLLLFVLMNARYRVAALRYLADVSSLDGIAFRSRARLRRVLLYALVLVAVMIATYAMLFLVLAGMQAAGSDPAAAIGSLALVVVLLFFAAIVYQLFFTFPLVRHIVTTLEISDIAALDNVVQGTRADPRFGEGLLDALDVEIDVA